MASSNFAPRNSPPLPAQKRYSFNNTPFIKLYHCYHHISTILLILRQQFKSNFYKHFYNKPVSIVIILLKISSFLFYLYYCYHHISTILLILRQQFKSNFYKHFYNKPVSIVIILLKISSFLFYLY